MVKQNTITWIILLLLTIVAGWISNISLASFYPIILILASLKFIGVAFGFMEMNKAHTFWKILIIGYLAIFCGLIFILF